MQKSDYEKIELFLSCRNLKNSDIFRKSHPQILLFLKEHGKWKLLGKTEIQKDTSNPNFSISFDLDFVFEMQQLLRFEVLDIGGSTSFDFIGSFEVTLGNIMGTKKQTLIGNLQNKAGKNTGKLIMRGERKGNSISAIKWKWRGVKLMNTDGWFDKSDPLLRFFKKRGDGEWLQVHETEIIMNNLNPFWKEFEIKDDKLCGGDHSRPIRIECWDWEKSGKYQYIGDCEITINTLKNGVTDFELHHPKKKKKTGVLRLLGMEILEKYSFLDYIRGGEQLNIMVAIDFTTSNGSPQSPDSLHSRVKQELNQYQKAMVSVCQILLNYDYDQKVAVYGFGGKPHFPCITSHLVSHCFPCTGNPAEAEVEGLDGIMQVYDYALNHVEFSGPTLFSPIINEAMKAAQTNKKEATDIYTILLILTDGEIHDMDKTIESICAASHLPLSIIIVGIGDADFTKMEILDGDNGLFDHSGNKAKRDLVQFVPFRTFNGDMIQLAQNVLTEVPDQLVGYMELVGRKPKPPPHFNMHSLDNLSNDTSHAQPSEATETYQAFITHNNQNPEKKSEHGHKDVKFVKWQTTGPETVTQTQSTSPTQINYHTMETLGMFDSMKVQSNYLEQFKKPQGFNF